MDEFFSIEKCLGEVAGVINLTFQAEPFTIDKSEDVHHKFPVVVAVKKVVKAAEGEGDGEEEEPAAEEATPEEAAGPQFNPRDH